MAKRTRRDYGSGSVYQRKSDGRWIGTIEVGVERVGAQEYVRRRKTVSGKTKMEVVAKLRKLEPDAVTNVPTVAKWMATWLQEMAANRVRPATLKAHRSLSAKHIVPHLGRHRLDKLTAPQILRWHETLRATPAKRGGGKLTDDTVLRCHAVLSKALEDARRLGYIRRNPARNVDRPRKGATEVSFLDSSQAATLLEGAQTDPLGSRWAFAVLTGQRQGECLGLRWSHVDLDQGVADVAWQLQRLGYVHGCDPPCGRRFAGDCPQGELEVPPGFEHHQLDGALCLTRPKSAVHIIPLVPSLVAWLERRRESVEPGPHDLVWTRDGGRPIELRDDYQAWVHLLARCGLPRVKLHSARHTCASLLLDLGVQEAAIMQLVGHSTVAAARRYQHMDLRAARTAALRLAQVLKVEPAEHPELPGS